jgi:hypothetical protein
MRIGGTLEQAKPHNQGLERTAGVQKGTFMATRPVSKTAFKRALELIGKPGGRQLKFLQAHYSSPGRASTATNLAWAAGYKNFNALNLQYGTLARRIGEALGVSGATLGLLLEFNEPFSITNEHWILSMRPEFADALREVGWVRS